MAVERLGEPARASPGGMTRQGQEVAAASQQFGTGGDGASGSSPPMLPFPSSTFILGGLAAGAGGGGGGGGGGEGFLVTTGGGGGGGGAGGGILELAAGEQIRIRGRVAALGGDGGDGAFPFAVGPLPSPPPFHAGCGGGGGGGAGGAIFLRGLRALVGEVLAVGGTDGRPARFAGAAVTTPGTLTQLQRLLANPPSGMIKIEGSVTPAATIAPAPAFVADIDYLPELVTGNPQIAVSGVGGLGGNGHVRVRNDAGQQLIPTPGGQPFTVQVALAPGFNTIDGVEVAEFGMPPTISTESHPVRVRRILYLPGAATVSGFACTISPATATVATERTVKLVAAVTGDLPHRRYVVGRRGRRERRRRSAGHLPRPL